MYQAKLIAIMVAIGTVLQLCAELLMEKMDWEMNKYVLAFICYLIGWLLSNLIMHKADPRTPEQREKDRQTEDRLADQKYDYKLLDGKKHRKNRF